jgi:hypothetical protein
MKSPILWSAWHSLIKTLNKLMWILRYEQNPNIETSVIIWVKFAKYEQITSYTANRLWFDFLLPEYNKNWNSSFKEESTTAKTSPAFFTHNFCMKRQVSAKRSFQTVRIFKSARVQKPLSKIVGNFKSATVPTVGKNTISQAGGSFVLLYCSLAIYSIL